MNSKIFYLIILFVLISCNQKSEKETVLKDNFSMVLEGVFSKNDKLQVFYLIDGKDWNDENSIVAPVYASSEMQSVKIDFPEKIFPKNIRVDLGENEYQTNITLKNITVLYKNDTIDGDNDNYKIYFYPNEFISWDPLYFGYKLSKINNLYDPYFMGNDLLMDKLDQIKNPLKE